MSSRIKSLKLLQTEFIPKAKGVRQKQRVEDLLSLYRDSKIYSKIGARKEVNRYLGSFKNEQQRDLHFFQNDE